MKTTINSIIAKDASYSNLMIGATIVSILTLINPTTTYTSTIIDETKLIVPKAHISKSGSTYSGSKFEKQFYLDKHIIKQQLEFFINLDENWDTYGAARPSKVAYDSALAFVEKSYSDGLFAYYTYPGVNGDILIEYKINDDKSIEIYFNADQSVEVLLFDGFDCVELSKDQNWYDLLKVYVN